MEVITPNPSPPVERDGINLKPDARRYLDIAPLAWAREIIEGAPVGKMPVYNVIPYKLRDTPARKQRLASEPSASSQFMLLKEEAALGVGGYGTVIRARHVPSGEIVAAKVMTAESAKALPVQQEVALMASLRHPSIVQLLGHGAVGEQYVLYIELCANGELFSRVRRAGNLAEDEAARYCGQILGGVAHMHAMGIVHRDLKLENMLLDVHDQCKICDFGLAHAYTVHDSPDDRWLFEICGSKSYAAPEVLEGYGYDGYSSDMWSLGICLFAMLAGFFPFDEASTLDWRFEQASYAAAVHRSVSYTIFSFYDRPFTLSQACTNLLDAMLDTAPADRPTAQEGLTSPWIDHGAAEDQQTGTITPPPFKQGWRVAHADASLGASLTSADGDVAMEEPSPPIYRSGGACRAPSAPPLLVPQPAFYRPNGSGEQLLREASRVLHAASTRISADSNGSACTIC